MIPERARMLRAWAKGSYAYEAGVELIIRSPLVGDRMAVSGYIHTHDTDPEVSPGYAWPDVAGWMAVAALSGGEHRLAAVIANLLEQERDPEHDDEYALDRLSLPDLAGLDYWHAQLVLAALSHAMGVHEMASVRVENGRLVGLGDYCTPLVTWPDEAQP